MQAYYQRLVGKGFEVEYVDAFDKRAAVGSLITSLAERGVKQLHVGWSGFHEGANVRKAERRLAEQSAPEIVILKNISWHLYF